jgi:hypothetical protein
MLSARSAVPAVNPVANQERPTCGGPRNADHRLAQVQMLFPIEPREVRQSQAGEGLVQPHLSNKNQQRNIVRLGRATHKLANLGQNGIYNFLRRRSPWLG